MPNNSRPLYVADRNLDSVKITESKELKHHIKIVVFYTEKNLDTLVFQSNLKIWFLCSRGTNYIQEEQRPFTSPHIPLFLTTAPVKVLENK